MDAVGLIEYEKVEVFNINNGARFETYVIEGERGSGVIGVNGAAARLVHLHDEIIIVNYAWMAPDEMKNHIPKVIIVSESNKSYHREL
jgi:aspartate 1-decarboxylase